MHANQGNNSTEFIDHRICPLGRFEYLTMEHGLTMLWLGNLRELNVSHCDAYTVCHIHCDTDRQCDTECDTEASSYGQLTKHQKEYLTIVSLYFCLW